MSDILIIYVVYGLVCGGYCTSLALVKNYKQWPWFFGGLFFGIIALIAIAGLPPQGEPRKPS